MAGKTLWRVPHGGVTVLGDSGKDIGSIAPRGGVVVMAGGLVLAGTTSDRKLRAYDQDTGKVLWETDVPAPPECVPSIYQASGREQLCQQAAAEFFNLALQQRIRFLPLRRRSTSCLRWGKNSRCEDMYVVAALGRVPGLLNAG